MRKNIDLICLPKNAELNLTNLTDTKQIILDNSLKAFAISEKQNSNLNLNEIKYEINSYKQFFAGYMAACTSITLLFPLNKLIFRQMLENIGIKEAFIQLKSEGYASFYRGLLPPLLQKSTSYSIMFGTQHEYYLILKSLKPFFLLT